MEIFSFCHRWFVIVKVTHWQGPSEGVQVSVYEILNTSNQRVLENVSAPIVPGPTAGAADWDINGNLYVR